MPGHEARITASELRTLYEVIDALTARVAALERRPTMVVNKAAELQSRGVQHERSSHT